MSIESFGEYKENTKVFITFIDGISFKDPKHLHLNPCPHLNV
jgi:hypothetical protein